MPEAQQVIHSYTTHQQAHCDAHIDMHDIVRITILCLSRWMSCRRRPSK